jgi:hypothetical protein
MQESSDYLEARMKGSTDVTRVYTGGFVPLPALEPVEYPEHVETYGQRILRLYVAGEITHEQYLSWK